MCLSVPVALVVTVSTLLFSPFLLFGRRACGFLCDLFGMIAKQCKNARRGAAGGGGGRWVFSGLVLLEDVFLPDGWEVAVAL